MAIIVSNESSLERDPMQEAIQQALAGMDLSRVQDSRAAFRYAVSSVDQGNVPTLVGAQTGGNSGTLGPTSPVTIIGEDSVVTTTTANLTVIKLVSDQGGGGLPGNTYYYGTGPTGTKGFYTVASTMAVASTARMTDTIDSNGVSTFDLATVADSGTGSLLALVKDAWGRITGTKAATITGTAGRVTVANGNASAGLPTIDLATTSVAAGSYGDATHVATFTVDAYGRLTAASSTPIAVIPQGYIDGLQMIWNSATSISVTSGTAYIPSLGNVLVSNATLTLSGLSLAASTWYHVYLYSNAGTPAIECVTTAPIRYYGTAYQKTGDNTRRYLWSVRTNSASSILQFEIDSSGAFWYSVQPAANGLRALSNGMAITRTPISLSIGVPVTSTRVELEVINTDTSVFVNLGNPSQVSGGVLGVAPGGSKAGAIITFVSDSSQNIDYFYTTTPTSGFYVDIYGFFVSR